MVGDHTQRWSNSSGSKVGSDQFEFSDIGADASDDINGYCASQAANFDKQCHQFQRSTGSGNPRYGDYTDGINSDGTQCNAWETDVEKSYCLGQDCMFDYCLLRRDQYMTDCLALAATWVQAIDGLQCKNGKTDSNNKCWRLQRNSDAVEIEAPDGSSAKHFAFWRARNDLLPIPNYANDVYNFDNMEAE